jgi:hypothetical protein
MVSVLNRGFDRYSNPVDARLEVRGQAFDDGTKPVLARGAWVDLHWRAERVQELAAAAPERQSDTEGGQLSGRQAVPSADGDEVVVSMCLHAWVTITESLSDTGVVRRIRNACGDDPLFNASFEMPALALRGFPHCNHIDPATQRNESTQLQSCLALRGEDRIAAAEVLNILSGPSVDEVRDLAAHLSPDAQVLIAGRADALLGAAAAEALSGAAFDRMRIYSGPFDGRAGEVAVPGLISRYVDDRSEQAEVQMVWRRQDGRWRLSRMTVGPVAVKE